MQIELASYNFKVHRKISVQRKERAELKELDESASINKHLLKLS